MKRIALSMAFGAIAIGAGLAACSPAHQAVPTSSKTAAPQQVQIPDTVKVPSGNKLAGSFEGHGGPRKPVRSCGCAPTRGLKNVAACCSLRLRNHPSVR